MIQSLSDKYKKHIAYPLFIIFYLQIISPLAAVAHEYVPLPDSYRSSYTKPFSKKNNAPVLVEKSNVGDKNAHVAKKIAIKKASVVLMSPRKTNIGGPASPEASSFKSIGTDNLVNLFSGSLSYSIPLMDVDGYPVNLFYNGGVTMDQDASWVGLGWNINPGSVSRSMRGVPDDFDGTDMLTVTQALKRNRTWGGSVAVDAELIGLKFPNGTVSVGVSYNNYLGPALDLGAGLSLSLPATEATKSEKAVSASLGLNVDLSSRSGLTFSPSLNANVSLLGNSLSQGVRLNTSYNSRVGMKSLTISGETSVAQLGRMGNAVLGHTLLEGSTISFAKPSFIPTMRMPMENSYTSGQVELGGGIFGLRGSATLDGYYTESSVPSEWQHVQKPLVGYMYSENAVANEDAVMDFNRFNDAEVTPNTPVISAPQYNYDVFSIQGEGTGGTIRAYRGDMGFMRDNVTVSKDNSLSLGIDIAPPGHYGGNFNTVSTPSRIDGWQNTAENTLNNTMTFQGPDKTGGSFENVYFKNPGELTVTNDQLVSRIGGDKLVRFQLAGSAASPVLQSNLELFDKKTGSANGTYSFIGNTKLQNRDKRTQVTTMLTADQATQVGLEKTIRNYATGAGLIVNGTLQYSDIPRTGGYRQGHHISEIDVLEQNGMKYVYGIPVYNTRQKDFTFSVAETPADPVANLVKYAPSEPTSGSSLIANGTLQVDGYLQEQETPAYASSFLLTGLVSPDYVDVTNNGITEDDLGTAVKFDYTESSSLHRWRTPRTLQGSTGTDAGNIASFNDGTRTEKRDNKAVVSYGDREAWYLSAIESKSMIAIFTTAARYDAQGVVGDLGSPDGFDGKINATENANKKLIRIDLYTKASIVSSGGIAYAKPIKTVKFNYSYTLCKGTPDNGNGGQSDNAGGKLTLESIEFSYNGQTRLAKERYVFDYGNKSSKADNPDYGNNLTDRWGVYKPVTDPTTGNKVNPNGLNNIDYPYTNTDKTVDDQYAAAWNLRKVLLPSGGQMEFQYETNDYAYVQNRRACNMFTIAGIGNSTNYSGGNGMYNSQAFSTDNYFVYVKLPQALDNTDPVKIKQEIYSKYLQDLNQLAFKLMINMPKGPEPLTVYTTYDDYGICSNDSKYIYLKLTPQKGESPLAISAIGFLTGNLPAQAFPGYDVDVTSVSDFVAIVPDMLSSVASAFQNSDQQMRSGPNGSKARTIVMGSSFVRLNNPYEAKYGGGVRVKRVTLKDNWNAMTGQYLSQYGQDYDYTTTEINNGVTNTISSGVASYEPGIGSEENPFREIVSFNNKMPLASAQYGAIEMPMLEGLYPGASVGYSKITVRSINRKGMYGDLTLRSAIGKQVTEFYTAKEYPSFSNYTGMTSMDYNLNPFFSFFNKKVVNDRTVSQGFLVETNDMHGKMKSQTVYSESDENTPLSYSYHFYKNTGQNGLNDKVDFVHNEQSGAVVSGNIGIDMELMTDTREFDLEANGLSIQPQIDIYPVVVPFTLFTLWPTTTYQENKYRAVTCTKLINYHAIEDSVVVMDKGSVVTTKTIAYDAETGNAIVTKTLNEFNDAIYNTTYPAYWAYSGMAPAYKNIGLKFSGVNFNSGKIVGGITDQSIFESGDELYVTAGGGQPDCVAETPNITKLWVVDGNKNNTALTVPSAQRNLFFIDASGNLFTQSNVSFTIIRSGKRNTIGLSAATETSMNNPIQGSGNTRQLLVNSTSNVVTASAIEYKEKWGTDNDQFYKYTTQTITTAPSQGPNLIRNGDFSNDNDGNFSSDFGYKTSYTVYPEYQGGGYYGVTTNSNAWQPQLQQCTDHTTGNGKMMVINGGQDGKTVWAENITVQPNTVYNFSTWVQLVSMYKYPPQLQLNIMSNTTQAKTTVGNLFDVEPNPGLWKNIVVTGWNSGNNTSIKIYLTCSSTYNTPRSSNYYCFGNDYALDDIAFTADNGGLCTSTQTTKVADCNGQLETNINPYTKGLIGNFKPYRSYTFYSTRSEVDFSSQTTVRKHGYLAGFNNYWNFNNLSNLSPDPSNTNWVWNSQLTKINSKGQELETQDALNRYTAAQYGYAKNLPVAITQNARYGESFYEGFEDESYTESLNKVKINTCGKSYFDQSGAKLSGGNQNSSFILQSVTSNPNSTSQAITPSHSGTHLLHVDANEKVTIPLSVKPIVDNYNLIYNTVSASQLNGLGGNISSSATSDWNIPNSLNYSQSTSFPSSHQNGFYGINNNVGAFAQFNSKPLYLKNQSSANVDFTQYVKINTAGSYNFTTLYNNQILDNYADNLPGSNPIHNYGNNLISYYNDLTQSFYVGTPYPSSSFLLQFSGTYQATIAPVNGNGATTSLKLFGTFGSPIGAPIGHTGLPPGNNIVTATFETLLNYQQDPPIFNYLNETGEVAQQTVYLCPGIYKIDFSGLGKWNYNASGGQAYSATAHYLLALGYNIEGASIGYQNLNSSGGCTSNVPIPATESMENTNFTLVPGKKMLFSAWVREDCNNAIPCNLTNYINNQISIQFPGSKATVSTFVFTPSGPIIDGWQKVEASFTVPADATTANMVFANNGSSGRVYFDDIRIQPFNSNMKSYVYDPSTLRLSAELDENNYATFYDYDEEGQLVRVKKETSAGIKTINETRNAKQKSITTVQ